MAQSQVTVESNFSRGLISEATGLSFPKDACTDTLNCVFGQDGIVTRRKGFDYESSYSTTTVTRSSSVMTEYVWESVGGDGNLSFVVLQVGSTLSFYSVPTSGALSDYRKSFTVSLANFDVTGAPTTAGKACSFSSGFGDLFVAHPYCEPFYVSYTASSDTITTGLIEVWVRDLIGIEEDIPFNLRPDSLTAEHKYNLWNQGWYAGYQIMRDFNGAVFNDVPFEAWELVRNDSRVGGYPSNADIWWVDRDSTNYFALGAVIQRGRVPDNTPAPKGHYLLRAFKQRKGESKIKYIAQSGGASTATVTLYESVPFLAGSTVTIEGSSVTRFNGTFTVSSTGTDLNNQNFVIPISGSTAADVAYEDSDFYCCIAETTEAWLSAGYQRPSAIAFFAGRVWYGGTSAKAFNDKLYFTKIIEQKSDYGRCHQTNDPTAEELSDLLPSDGGVISIPEMGNVIKMIPVGDDLVVFASNGIWAVTGSEGIGFTANDYSVKKVSSVPSVSQNSFVLVDGAPVFWNNDGIYTLTGDGLKSVSDDKIKTWFRALPTNAKANAKGAYNPFESTVYWTYRSTSGSTTENTYEYDRVLTLNMLTGSFSPWSITRDNFYPTVNGIVVTQYTGSSPSKTKFITTKNTAGSNYSLTFSETLDTNYEDWETPNVGVSYSSYFNTGFKVAGSGLAHQFGNYINVFCNVESNSSAKLRAKWDYSNSSYSGEWSSEQEVYVTKSYRNTLRRRVKLRGRGISCQLAFRSSANQPFNIIGWSMVETVNQGP
jgi:hypothetical protein